MSEFNVRSDAVDVEQIMRQIRARIREKRGADYTEAELQQLATVKLEKFLDPRGVRSDLVEQFRAQRVVSPEPPSYEFDDTTLYETHRGALRFIRKLLHPLLKLFFNPDPLIHALHMQAQVNDAGRTRASAGARRWTRSTTRSIHNLVARDHAARHRGAQPQDARRVAVEPAGLRRAPRRSLESVVQYRLAVRAGRQRRRSQAAPRQRPSRAAAAGDGRLAAARQPRPAGQRGQPSAGVAGLGAGLRRRTPAATRAATPRRRRRRRRRPGQTLADGQRRRPGGQRRPMRGRRRRRRPVAGPTATARRRRRAALDRRWRAGRRRLRRLPTSRRRRRWRRRRSVRSVKLAIVVQRYGADISGGAELHARYIAERLRGTPRSRCSRPARATTSPGRTSCRPARRPSTASPVRRFPVVASARTATSSAGGREASSNEHALDRGRTALARRAKGRRARR